MIAHNTLTTVLDVTRPPLPRRRHPHRARRGHRHTGWRLESPRSIAGCATAGLICLILAGVYWLMGACAPIPAPMPAFAPMSATSTTAPGGHLGLIVGLAGAGSDG